jgi:hypothetical protein
LQEDRANGRGTSLQGVVKKRLLAFSY